MKFIKSFNCFVNESLLTLNEAKFIFNSKDKFDDFDAMQKMYITEDMNVMEAFEKFKEYYNKDKNTAYLGFLTFLCVYGSNMDDAGYDDTIWLNTINSLIILFLNMYKQNKLDIKKIQVNIENLDDVYDALYN
jgi:hypothetical protein